MNQTQLAEFITALIAEIDSQIPSYKASDIDWKISEGHVALCIIDDAGNVYGKIWGDNKLKGRKYYDVAYRKASQCWITGYKTNEFERLVFTDQLNYRDFGIDLPDLMGWEGGQPIQLDNESKIYCGFSGFKGKTDLAIVANAVKKILS